VAAGAGKVAGGAKQLEGGVGQLGAGLGKLKDGAGQLDDGAGQLATGASQLHSGLNDAAVGSGKLADGLATAADSAPQLADGAQRLSDEGTKKLVEAGKGTAADYGEKYALIVAGAERAKSEGMAYGAPEGATGVTAYSLELAGMNGESGRNVGRGLGALVVLGFGTGAAALVRRRLV
jgi:putative membrane protein